MDDLTIIACVSILGLVMIMIPTILIGGLYMMNYMDQQAKNARESMRHERALAQLEFEAQSQEGGESEEGPDFLGIVQGLVPDLFGPKQNQATAPQEPTKEIENGKTC